MRFTRFGIPVLALAASIALNGCARKEQAAEAAPTPSAAPAAQDAGKIPVTTSSDAARAEFLQGRDLQEKLRVTDSIAHFAKAAQLDPGFAMAELSLSATAPTGKEFFEHLKKAVSLADKVSNGERLLIQAAEAGSNGDAVKQKDLLEQLVAAYPNDERAHFTAGAYYFGQQDYPAAIEHYKKATAINPSYSGAWNILGYAYRQMGDYANAEQAFRKYVELIPGDPNPYDSLAELYLKEGKFDESIAQYRKALEIDPSFLNSHMGIAAALLYAGKPDEAAAEAQKFSEKARNDGEKRTALFVLAVIHADNGKLDKALSDMDQQYAIAQKGSDPAGMAGDLLAKGNIFLEQGKYDQAKAQYDQALKIIQESNLSDEVKGNQARFHHFNMARVALGKKDLATAKTEAAEFGKLAEASHNPFQAKLAHTLNGIVALNGKDWDKAIAELQQGNLQDPYNLYRLALAYQGKGDKEKAKEFAAKAADFNALPALNAAFVRTKAKKAASA
ncbi:MAG TPA: tetratricopeptide repeat protein [Thermoanaerobaculia bacterium]